MNKKLLLISIAVLVILVIAVIFAVNNKEKASLTSQKNTGGVSVSGLLSQAKNLVAQGDLLSAKTIYQSMVNDFPNSAEVTNWQKKIEDINLKLLFSPALTAKSRLYEIKPGDTLTKIAREFKTTADLIKKSNNLSDDKIIPGRKIKVWTAGFSVLVDKSQNILILKSEEEIIKTYIVSTGKNNSTPVGNFKITSKLINPTWFKAGAVVSAGSPENILGTRWMGFDLPSYGIHGTTEPQSLGKQVTQGCVRMSNSEVEELYTIIPLGTEVSIVD
ncbi:MAG: L,D-transpeptidase family protein [Candidatus Omnitrophica bacterium]|nr:L,D-transpeptidase family protein [Candidatus Omnitrophota bacterium]